MYPDLLIRMLYDTGYITFTSDYNILEFCHVVNSSILKRTNLPLTFISNRFWKFFVTFLLLHRS